MSRSQRYDINMINIVLQRFESMFKKNMPEKGGSFYLQSKIYFAKEHLMQDFPSELNKSEFNPTPEEAQKTTEEQKQEAGKDEQKKE